MANIHSYIRNFAKGKSFECAPWKDYLNYQNDEIQQDFVFLDSSIYVCTKSNSGVNPKIDTLNGKQIGTCWTQVMKSVVGDLVTEPDNVTLIVNDLDTVEVADNSLSLNKMNAVFKASWNELFASTFKATLSVSPVTIEKTVDTPITLTAHLVGFSGKEVDSSLYTVKFYKNSISEENLITSPCTINDSTTFYARITFGGNIYDASATVSSYINYHFKYGFGTTAQYVFQNGAEFISKTGSPAKTVNSVNNTEVNAYWYFLVPTGATQPTKFLWNEYGLAINKITSETVEGYTIWRTVSQYPNNIIANIQIS